MKSLVGFFMFTISVNAVAATPVCEAYTRTYNQLERHLEKGHSRQYEMLINFSAATLGTGGAVTLASAALLRMHERRAAQMLTQEISKMLVDELHKGVPVGMNSLNFVLSKIENLNFVVDADASLPKVAQDQISQQLSIVKDRYRRLRTSEMIDDATKSMRQQNFNRIAKILTEVEIDPKLPIDESFAVEQAAKLREPLRRIADEIAQQIAHPLVTTSGFIKDHLNIVAKSTFYAATKGACAGGCDEVFRAVSKKLGISLAALGEIFSKISSTTARRGIFAGFGATVGGLVGLAVGTVADAAMDSTALGGSLREMYNRDPSLVYDNETPESFCAMEKELISEEVKKSILELDAVFEKRGFYPKATTTPTKTNPAAR